MKKLLSFLGAVGLITTSSTGIMAMSQNVKTVPMQGTFDLSTINKKLLWTDKTAMYGLTFNRYITDYKLIMAINLNLFLILI